MPSFEVRQPIDIFRARTGVRKVAEEIGFPPRICGELTIVASELSSNIIKYGIRGRIDVEPAVREGMVVGVTLQAHDIGPPFHSFETALVDGCNDKGPIDPSDFLRRGGLGAGLGAVLRMSDSLRLEYEDQGKCIVVTRYLRRSAKGAV